MEVLIGKQRKSWSVDQRLTIVLSVLSERQSIAELSRQHGVSENQIYRWKEQFLASGRLCARKARPQIGYPVMVRSSTDGRVGLAAAATEQKKREKYEVVAEQDRPDSCRVQIDATRLSFDGQAAWVYLVEDVNTRQCLAAGP